MNIFEGEVVSTKMTKTATVLVERVVVHPKYKRRYQVTKKYHVDDSLGAKVGDRVRFVPTRPISKLKRWKIIEILKKK